ncbi:MAG: hypothetical protein JW801_02525 [Bacteroidales bacterium]|nr:hypothetical protein [Bacteroidales bacterium]
MIQKVEEAVHISGHEAKIEIIDTIDEMLNYRTWILPTLVINEKIVARKLSRNDVRKMNCLTVAATGTEEKIDEFKKCNILIIDGCTEDCGRKIMEMRGITDYRYLRLTDLGYEKGKTPTSQEIIQIVYEKAEVVY